MVPSTVGSLLGFLGLIAPGLVFELRRERRRPSYEESVFREISRLALVSLVFTMLSLSIVLALCSWIDHSYLPDVNRWVVEGNVYLKAKYGSVLLAFLLELAFACALAALWDGFLSRSATGNMTPWPSWYLLFREFRPAGTKPWVHLQLENGAEYWGYMANYTATDDLERREISLRGPRLTWRSGQPQASRRFLREPVVPETQRLDEWDTVTVRGDKIVAMTVTYISDETGEVVKR